MWGHWGGAAHGLCHTVVLCTWHLPTAGGRLWSGLAVLTGASYRLLRRCSRCSLSKLGLVWVSRLDALFSKVYQALLLGRFYAAFPEDLNLGRPPSRVDVIFLSKFRL